MSEAATVDLDTISVHVGDAVRVCNETGRITVGLVTAVFGYGSKAELEAAGQPYNFSPPAINVVYVSLDQDKKDPYGLQLERLSSTSWRGSTEAPGRWWDML